MDRDGPGTAMETETDPSDLQGELRRLPSVERLATEVAEASRHVAVNSARAELADARAEILAGRPPPAEEELVRATARRAARLAQPSLRRVINATGVVLHTNLGRAPLPKAAVDAIAAVAGGYSNLEYSLDEGGRGSRGQHAEPLLRELTGTEAALAVNNNAAAVMLALAALARDGEVLIGRGELIEIGGSFRIPDILAQSGATLVEVGATNRTRLDDYRAAICERTTAILHVHHSNFRMVGFTDQPELADLAGLAAAHRLPLIDDLGSGALEEVHGEPTIGASLRAGTTLVCCSADKLLGGPQAGLLLGDAEALDRCRQHPLARAFRLDKLQIAALEASLRAYRDEGADAIPVLSMMRASTQELEQRAESMAKVLGGSASVSEDTAVPGGGALADVQLPGPVCSVDPGELGAAKLAARLREADPPVIARIVRDRVVLDPRTMTDGDAAQAAAIAGDALA